MNFLPVKKTKKNQKSAREKKSGREKTEKWAKKWAWKRKNAREKTQKKAKNGFHGQLYYFFHGEEKKTLSIPIQTSL